MNGDMDRFLGKIKLSRKLNLSKAEELLGLQELSSAKIKALTGVEGDFVWAPNKKLNAIVFSHPWGRFEGSIQILKWLLESWLRSKNIKASGEMLYNSVDDFGSGRLIVANNILTIDRFREPRDVEPLTAEDLKG